ncbi:restriction endonuclease subunit S [Rhizobium sp. SRDI969]|uniref:restriction endonuclease subunit S n=1 Tax=Rhizobium sp. SRDI969 TaxID=3138252 RepID=UPI0021A2DC37|nr:restriction endonuclease subunit S [Rhizobium leguminosarum]UWM82403.1 restriction endonuclease subunit S [Rhizobium leguminosarum bv. viciae]
MNARVARLGELVEIRGGGTPSKDVPEYWNGPIPWVSVKDFKTTEIMRTVDTITAAGVANSATNIIPAGNILVPTRMAVGKAAINKAPMAINQDIKALFPASDVSVRYLLHALLANGRVLERMATGATVKGITLDVLKALEIPLPSLEEQKRIAAILDKADQLRQKRRQAIALLDSLTQSIFLEMFGDPVSNPKQWQEATLGDVIYQASDGPHVSPQYCDDGIPFLSTRHIQRGAILWQDLKYISEEDAKLHWRKCKPQRGDLLYTKGGTTGIAAEVDFDEPFAVWVHVALLKTRQDVVQPKWLECMLNSNYCYSQSQIYTHGIANRDLGLKRMVKIKLFLPPLEAQAAFVDNCASLERLIRRCELQLVEADNLFLSLQHHAFSGQL